MKTTKKEISHSEYQLAIFDWIQKGTGNAIVSAVAGSGKTTTMLDALGLLPEGTTSLFLSFNKEIQLSTKQKLKARDVMGVHVYTNHSFGYALIMKHLKFVTPKTQDDKYEKICNSFFVAEKERLLCAHKIEVQKDKTMHDKSFYKCFCSKALRRKVSTICMFVDYGRMFCLENVSEIAKKIRYMGKTYDEAISLSEIEKFYLEAQKQGLLDLLRVDYMDMLWVPIQKNIEPKDKFDFVFLDECQDLNAVQIKLVQQTIQTTGARLLAVGDPQQAIYGFAGALPTAWDDVKNAFDAKVFPLSVCYRCGSKIVNLAKNIVPQIASCSDAIRGEITEIEHFGIQFILNNVQAVLSRFFAPLVHILCKGLPFSNKIRLLGVEISRTMEADLSAIIKNKSLKLTGCEISLRERIKLFFAQKIEDSGGDGNDLVVMGLEDRMASLLFFEEISDHSENGILSLLEKYMTEKPQKDDIVLSTIHKAKGQEWDSILVLGYNQMPHHFDSSPAWQDEQEKNLQYIAITRAKKHLFQHCPTDPYWYRKEFVYEENDTLEQERVTTISECEDKNQSYTKNITQSAQIDISDDDALRQIEKCLTIAQGSSSDVPEWARPAIKYFRQPAAHGLNLTIADFPPADAPNAVERYNAWLAKNALGNIGLSDKYTR